MEIAIVGTGHVGLVTGACLAEIGHRVVCIDDDRGKIATLKRGGMPFYEPFLEELVKRNWAQGRLHFVERLEEGIERALVIFISVGTPPLESGEADLSSVEQVSRRIAEAATSYKLVVEKSTVPVQTGRWIERTLKIYNSSGEAEFDVASNPEFLREGSAVEDFFHPDRIVIGVGNPRSEGILRELYAPIVEGTFPCPIHRPCSKTHPVPFLVTNIESAELIKHASNSFLAMKISFINALADLCERSGADVKLVAEGMGLDRRIGPAFLNAGIGFGGFCFRGDESTFTRDGRHLTVQPFEALFARFPKVAVLDEGEVAVPEGCFTLSFDLGLRRPTFTKVKALTRRFYKGRLIEIRTRMGRRLRLTEDHPVILYDRGADRFRIVLARDVLVGDNLVVVDAPSAMEAPKSVNLLEELLGSPLEATVKVRPSDEAFRRIYPQIVSQIPNQLMKNKYEIGRRNSMPLRVYRFLVERGLIDIERSNLQLFTGKGSITYCPAVFPLDEDFLRLLGYYVAQGWITVDRGRGGAIRERVGFSFGAHEGEYLADLHRILRRYGMRFLLKRIGQAYATVISSQPFAFLLRDLLGCGTRSEDKNLPRIIFEVDEKGKLTFLRGLFSGDGSIGKVQRGKNLVFEYATVSRPLADGLTLLLQSLGIVPSLRQCWMKGSTMPTYIVRLNGLAQRESFKDIFGEGKRQTMNAILARYQRPIAPFGFVRKEGFTILPVTKVESRETEEHVYSMETENGLLVCSSGLVVHNCFPKDLQAFVKIAEKLGYDFTLLKEVERINLSRIEVVLRKLKEALWILKGKRIGVWGLAFKPDTDDIREAPAIKIIKLLQREGALVQAYDPKAMEPAKAELRDVLFCRDPYEAAEGAEALILATEWQEFKEADLGKVKAVMRRPLFLDGRNLFEREWMLKLGFEYLGMGH